MAPIGGVRAGYLSAGKDAIPDSVTNQWVAPFFASPWDDEVGGAKMSVNSLSTTTINGNTFVSADGSSNNYGLADAPVFGDKSTWGIAFTINVNSADVGDFDTVCGLFDSSAVDGLRNRIVSDQMDISLRMNGNSVRYKGGTVADGTTHAIVLNRNGSRDYGIYVDDMSTDTGSVVLDETGGSGHNASDWTLSADWGFFCSNKEGNQKSFLNADIGTFEFNSSAYSLSERQNFVSRRPEV